MGLIDIFGWSCWNPWEVLCKTLHQSTCGPICLLNPWLTFKILSRGAQKCDKNMLAVHQLSNPCDMLVPQGGARPTLWPRLNHEDKSLHRISKTSCGTCTPCSTREAMAGCLFCWDVGCWRKGGLCWRSLGIFMGYKWGYCSNMMVLIDLISYLGVSEHGGWTRQIAITQYEKHWKKWGK